MNGEKNLSTREELEKIALEMRKDVLGMALSAGPKGAHIGGSLSIIELLTVLYADIMKYDVKNPSWDERDRLILSKAHAAIGLYAALHYAGYLSDKDIEGAFKPGSNLYKHPKMNIEKGFEFSAGSLGQGLSLAVGSAIALRNKGNSARLYVIIGDGECDEGSVWEAALSVTHFGLNNICIIVDRNGLQNDGTTEEIMNPCDFKNRFEVIGFEVDTVDGHDVEALRNVLNKQYNKPRVIISNTIKGKGVSFAENNVEWHMGTVTDELYEQAMREFGNDRN